jgi:hypothetical protein
LQMCSVRYVVGLFLEDPLEVPWPVIEHLAEELGIEDVSCVKRVNRAVEDGVRARVGDPGCVRLPPVRGPGSGAEVPYVPARSGVDAC